MKKFLSSIWDGLKSFAIMPAPSYAEPYSFRVLSDEEAMQKDAEALKGDWHRAIGSLDTELKEK